MTAEPAERRRRAHELAYPITQRHGRFLEHQWLPKRDAKDSYPAGDKPFDDGVGKLAEPTLHACMVTTAHRPAGLVRLLEVLASQHTTSWFLPCIGSRASAYGRDKAKPMGTAKDSCGLSFIKHEPSH